MDKPHFNIMGYPGQTMGNPNPSRQSEERDSLVYSKAGPLPEVSLTKDVNLAMEHYANLYERRYGSKPVYANIGIASTTMKDIFRSVQPEGTARVFALLETYLKSENKYHNERKHPLDVMLRDIQAISASTKVVTQTASYNPLISFESFCGNVKCNAPTAIVCKASQMGGKAYVDLCEECERWPNSLSETVGLNSSK